MPYGRVEPTDDVTRALCDAIRMRERLATDVRELDDGLDALASEDALRCNVDVWRESHSVVAVPIDMSAARPFLEAELQRKRQELEALDRKFAAAHGAFNG